MYLLVTNTVEFGESRNQKEVLKSLRFKCLQESEEPFNFTEDKEVFFLLRFYTDILASHLFYSFKYLTDQNYEMRYHSL